MHLVYDVDLVACRGGAIGDAVDDLADVADAGPARRVHLEHVDMAAFGNRDAGLADAAGLDGRTALPVFSNAVQTLGNDSCSRCLAHTTHAGQHEGMGDAVGLESVAERAYHRILADQIGEGLGPVLAREDAVGGFGLGQGAVARLDPAGRSLSGGVVRDKGAAPETGRNRRMHPVCIPYGCCTYRSKRFPDGADLAPGRQEPGPPDVPGRRPDLIDTGPGPSRGASRAARFHHGASFQVSITMRQTPSSSFR